MMERRFLRAAAGSIAALAAAVLTACSAATHSTTQSTPSAAVGTTAPVTAPSPSSSMKTLPPSRLCSTALTTSAAKQLIADPRLQTRLSPEKGEVPDGCSYVAADEKSTLALTPASRAYAAELAAAHALSADPASAGMRGVKVDPVSDLGRQAFRETSYQIQAGQHITFVVWDSGAGTWVLTFATTADSVSSDKVVQVARSITAKLPAAQ